MALRRGSCLLLYFLGFPLAMAAFWPIPEQELRCASFLKPYVAQMRSIHQQGTKWYFNQRNWDDYVRLLGLAWAQEVAALRPTEIWIDSGAGSGQALMDYLAQYSGQVVGISAALENWDKYWLAQAMQRYPGRFNFYVGLLETPLAYWPPLINSDILTDVYGPMAYTHAPDVVLAHYAALLRPGGKAWILLPQQGLHLYQRGRNLRTTTPLRPLAWRDYLAMGRGWVWLDEFEVQDGPYPVQIVGRMLVLQRTAEPVALPALEAQRQQFKFNIPPQRGFVLARKTTAAKRD